MSSYRKQQEKVFTRDNGLCRVCGKKAHHTHHIIYRSHQGNDSEQNLISLCSRCHRNAHHSEKEWRDKLIGMQEELYGTINVRELKKKDQYENFKYSKFR